MAGGPLRQPFAGVDFIPQQSEIYEFVLHSGSVCGTGIVPYTRAHLSMVTWSALIVPFVSKYTLEQKQDYVDTKITL